MVPKEKKFHELIVPTKETILATALLKLFIDNCLPSMLIGPTGTAKSISVKDCLKRYYSNAEYDYNLINFSG
jgi:hypothetical protein